MGIIFCIRYLRIWVGQNKMKVLRNRILISLVLFLLLFSLLPISPVSAWTWATGVTFNCDNEYYITSVSLDIDTVIIDTHWISVNGIGFNTTSAGNVYINFSTIKSSPLTDVGYIMNFTEQHVSGFTVQYIINGLKPSYDYIWMTNGSDYPQTSSASGTLYLNQTGTLRNHKLYDPGIPSSGIFVSLSTNTPPGSDTTGTGSIFYPYATLRKALNVSAEGDTIYIRGGTYTSLGTGATQYIIINRNHVTISSYNNENVIIDASGYTLTASYPALIFLYSGSTFYHGVTFYGINISHLTCDYGTAIQAYASASSACDDTTISHCSFYDIRPSGTHGGRAIVFFGVSTNQCDNLNINNCSFNYIQSNTTMNECISLQGCRDFIFENNTIRNFVKQFLSVSGGCCNGKIRYNSFDNKWYYSIKLDPYNNCNNTICYLDIYNNMFYGDAPSTTTHYPVSVYINPEATADGGSIHHINIYNNIFNISTATASYQCQGLNINLGLITTFTLSYVTIKYNTFYTRGSSSSSYDLRVTKGTGTLTNSVIANNIFCTDESSPNYQVSFVDLPSTQTSFMITNNQFYNYDGTTSGIDYSSGTDGFGTNGLGTNPQFVSKATKDFHLNSTSPCAESASSTYTVTTDYDGNTRPQFTYYDRGAYEYTGYTPPAPSFTFTLESPTNTSTGIALTPYVLVHVNETHGYKFNYTIQENKTIPGTWTDLTAINNVNNGTYSHTYHPATAYSTRYYWRFCAVNGTTWHNETYYFTTTTPTIPAFTFTAVSPTNESTGIPLLSDCHVYIAETHGFKYNYTMQENTTGTWVTRESDNNMVNSTATFVYTQASAYSTRYWWRVNAVNGTTWHNETYYFTTMDEPAPPTGITVSAVNANWTTSTSINITWAKGTGCTHSYLYRSTTGYLSGESLIYNGIGTSFNDTLKDPTQRYYYTLKARNATLGVWGNTINISLAETDNTTSYGASWLEFNGYMTTDKNIQTRFNYATNPSFTSAHINTTILEISYTTTATTLFNIYSTQLKGQTFLIGTTPYYLKNITINAYRTGLPGMIYCNLYAVGADHLPTGAALSTGSANANLFSTSYNWYNITMSSYLLSTGTRYAIVFSLGGNTTFSNRVTISVVDPGTYTSGQAFYSTGGGPYTNYTNMDIRFKVYGNEPASYGTFLSTSNTTISTSTAFDIIQSSLEPGQLYYYRVRGNDTNGNMTQGNTRYSLTKPMTPTFLYLLPSFTNHSINISWIPGAGANNTLIVKGTGSYPTTPSDGAILYNGTASSTWLTNISFNTSFKLSLFSYTTWAGLSRFSSATTIPWGGCTFIVYNLTNPTQSIWANIIVTDSLGLHPVQFNNVYGYYSFNISEIPYGKNTRFYISNSSYHSQLYVHDLSPDIFYNFSFYLAPLWKPPGGPPGGNETGSYRIQVINDYQVPVQGALVKFYLYMNTTMNYTYIGGFVSDGNGQGSIDIYPYNLYMIKITCDGYEDTTEFWIPNVIEQSLTISKTFKIYYSPLPEPDIFENLLVTIEPEQTNFYDSFTAYFNITSSDAQLEWMTATMSYYNSTTATWLGLFSQNTTTTTGDSISYTAPNITGNYQWSCSFGKTGFSNYTIIKTYSIITPANNSDPLDDMVKHIAGRSPIYVPTLSGETVVSWTALIASFVAIFVLFGFSPKFSGLAIMSTGGILGICKSPLGLIPNGVLNWVACGFIIILGILVIMADKKEGNE